MAILLVLIGVFSALGGWMNWNWFMENRRAKIFVWMLGRNGARAFYVLLGVAFIGFGLAGATGAISMR